MDKTELTDIVINSAIGARTLSFLTDFLLKQVKQAKRLTTDEAQEKYNSIADDYIQLLDNYYVHSEKDVSVDANRFYLRGVQDHLAYIHDIEVEGIVDKTFFERTKKLRAFSSYGAILIITAPLSMWTGGFGMASTSIYFGARLAERRINKFIAEVQKIADELAPIRDRLRDAEVSEIHEVLQENKARVNSILHPPVNEKPVHRRRKRRGYVGSAGGYRIKPVF
ncbi:MAG: hypothetical protein KJ955_00415 [Nanoarchaeota archaeon]|nr:hypothetical protein [Nanoarchaeota archaeon]